MGLTSWLLRFPAFRHWSSYTSSTSPSESTAFTPAMVSGARTSTVVSPSGT